MQRRLAALLALALIAIEGSAADPPPYPHRAANLRLLDSGVPVMRSVDAHWADEQTVVFSAPTSETWEHWQGLHQVPVVRLTAWNVRTGKIERFGEYHVNLCISKGQILYRTYRLKGNERAREKGVYMIDAWYGGPWNAAVSLGPEASAELNSKGYDRDTCVPKAKLTVPPDWLLKTKWWYHQLPHEFGVKVDRPVTSSPDRSLPPLICPYTATSERDCKALPFPGGHHYGYDYIEHLDSYAYMTNGLPDEPPLIIGLLDRKGNASVYSAFRRYPKGTAPTPLITAIGALYIESAFKDRSNDSNAGVWQLRDRRIVKLMSLFVQGSGSGQRSVSPDGCMIALTGNKHGGEARTTLHVLKLCGE